VAHRDPNGRWAISTPRPLASRDAGFRGWLNRDAARARGIAHTGVQIRAARALGQSIPSCNRSRVTTLGRSLARVIYMTKSTLDGDLILKRPPPITHPHGHEIQPFGRLVRMPIALSENACSESVDNLNQLLADTITLRDLYKKHHWQVAGPTFYQLHLLFDKH